MPLSYEQLNALRVGRGPKPTSPPSEFIEKWMARAEDAMMATSPLAMMFQTYKTTPTLLDLLNRAPQPGDLPAAAAEKASFLTTEKINALRSRVFRPSVTHEYCGNCPSCKAWDRIQGIYERSTVRPDILAITRDVARGG